MHCFVIEIHVIETRATIPRSSSHHQIPLKWILSFSCLFTFRSKQELNSISWHSKIYDIIMSSCSWTAKVQRQMTWSMIRIIIEIIIIEHFMDKLKIDFSAIAAKPNVSIIIAIHLELYMNDCSEFHIPTWDKPKETIFVCSVYGPQDRKSFSHEKSPTTSNPTQVLLKKSVLNFQEQISRCSARK